MTESEDANELVDANVAPVDMDIENVATVNQLEEANNENAAPEVNVEHASPDG